MVFFCCVRTFFWINYRIIESIGHLSFCKKINFYGGDCEKKMGHVFFVFFVGVQEKKYIYFTKKEKEKRRKKWQLGFDLIPSSFVFRSFYRCVHTDFHVKISNL